MLFALLVLLAVSASASEKPTFFANKAECVAALASGEFTAYTTRALWRGKKIEGEIKPLEAPACIEGEVVGGRNWVVVLAGFSLRWDGDKPVAMESCGGNPVYNIAQIPVGPTTYEKFVAEAPAPAITKTDLLETADKIVAAMPKPSDPPTVNIDRRWYCERHPVVCTLGGIALGGAFFVLNDGERGRDENVTTLPIRP